MSFRYSLPFEPLRTYSRLTLRTDDDSNLHRNLGANMMDLARVVGVHHDTVRGWAARGTISVHNADRAACALGVHPAFIWGDDYWNVILLANERWEASRAKTARRNNAAKARRRQQRQAHRSLAEQGA